MDPTRLHLGVTENVTLDDPTRVRAVMNELKQVGAHWRRDGTAPALSCSTRQAAPLLCATHPADPEQPPSYLGSGGAGEQKGRRHVPERHPPRDGGEPGAQFAFHQ